jgi:hypothetical protein
MKEKSFFIFFSFFKGLRVERVMFYRVEVESTDNMPRFLLVVLGRVGSGRVVVFPVILFL